MQYYPFNSRNPLYKSHIGAIASGEALKLRLLLHNDAHCHNAYLRIKNDSDNIIEEIELSPKEYLEDYRFYDCSISREEGLYWYCFRYTSDYGEFHVTKTESSLGIVSSEGNWWQLTVYSNDFSTPTSFEGGIIYQIFPDRFYNSGKIKENIPSDRFLCSDWRRQPEYRQNNGACSLGNDYYGGDIRGIIEKLPYIAKLGVTCIYLNPIFEAHSNHRYNTADYMKIDPSLGTEDDLEELCREAQKRGISIILDGVFSHTGDDSVYFNRYGRYSACGAYNSYESPYKDWYKFNRFPNDYSAWWGVPSLPETNETNPDFCEFITGENGVLRYWLKKGISGWRLDVADELPDSFLDRVRTAIKAENPDALILGEVWEDASNKISYDIRRRFLRGNQLDSVMNYPFSDALISFIVSGGGQKFINIVLDILENYPPCCINLLMNHIGTHDTMRIITRLSKKECPIGDREWQSHQTLSKQEYDNATVLLRLAAVLQYTLPGIPSLFYGDEAGLQGYGDPFCRASFPWGTEDTSLTEFYVSLGAFRRKNKVFKHGKLIPVLSENDLIIFERRDGNDGALIAINRGNDTLQKPLPQKYANTKEYFGQAPRDNTITLPPKSFSVLIN